MYILSNKWNHSIVCVSNLRNCVKLAAKKLLHKDEPHVDSPRHSTTLWCGRGQGHWCPSHLVGGQAGQSVQDHLQVLDLPRAHWPICLLPTGDLRNGGKLWQSGQLLTMYHKNQGRGRGNVCLWSNHDLLVELPMGVILMHNYSVFRQHQKPSKVCMSWKSPLVIWTP